MTGPARIPRVPGRRHRGWRGTYRLQAPALFAGLAVLCCASQACAPDAPTPGAGAPTAWRGTVLPEPVPKVDFTLTDTRGRPFRFLEETRGTLTLLFFGYTHCPDICPVHLANIAAVMRGWSWELRQRVRVVFVSTDPVRDTPERIRAWLDGFDRSFVGLRGTVEEVNAIERSLGLPPSFVDGEGDPEAYLVGHAAQVLAFTPDGFAHIAFPFGTRQADLAVDLPRLAREGFEPGDGP